MQYEYNGNLLEKDRINLVTNEIIKKYPQVSEEKARQAAMLEGKISSEKTVEIELERLYNIMLVNSENKNIVMMIYKDFISILKNNYDDSSLIKYTFLIEPINDYINDYAEFPFLEDYQ